MENLLDYSTYVNAAYVVATLTLVGLATLFVVQYFLAKNRQQK